jgi:glycosyltransferase involved in cell wall biosynthesis
MKVAFFTNTILEHGGGLEKYFIDTAVALAESHPLLDVTIITFNEERTEMLQRLLSIYYLKEMPIQNIYREKTESILKKLGRVRYVKCASFLQAKTELNRADVIYSKNEIIDLCILKYFGHKQLPPIIAGVHTPIFYPIAVSFHSKLHNFLYGGWLYRFLLKGLSGVHVTNKGNLLLLRKFGFSGSVNKIFNPFSFVSTETVFHSSDTFHVLFVGRINREKGVDLFIDCVQSLAQDTDFLKYKFKIAGSGDTDLVRQLEELDETYDNVSYVGHVPNTEIGDLYDWADVVLVPSHFETANYVALEAGSKGKIVIASNIPGPQDIVIDGVTGYLLPLSVQAFVDTLRTLAQVKTNHPEKLKEMGRTAKEHVRSNFDPGVLYGRFYNMICQAASMNNESKTL